MSKTCFFIGHRDAPGGLASELAELVEHSDFLIAYAQRPGNARELVEYAQRREKRGLIRVTVLPGVGAATDRRDGSPVG